MLRDKLTTSFYLECENLPWQYNFLERQNCYKWGQNRASLSVNSSFKIWISWSSENPPIINRSVLIDGDSIRSDQFVFQTQPKDLPRMVQLRRFRSLSFPFSLTKHPLSFHSHCFYLCTCLDNDGRITGNDATKFFAMSNLSRSELKQVLFSSFVLFYFLLRIYIYISAFYWFQIGDWSFWIKRVLGGNDELFCYNTDGCLIN